MGVSIDTREVTESDDRLSFGIGVEIEPSGGGAFGANRSSGGSSEPLEFNGDDTAQKNDAVILQQQRRF